MLYRIPKPFIFTLFGASGDLARLKIYPALYQLAVQKRLPKDYYIVGFSRTQKERAAFQQHVAESIRKKEGKYINESVLQNLIDHTYYFTGQYTDRSSFDQYRAFLKELVGKKNLTHLAYFSVPPVVFQDIVRYLAETKPRASEDVRLIIEKPFGTSQASAESLYHFITKYFHEDSVYLLDHFLGKSSVQSILHLRHANRLLNMVIQGSEIANIQITKFEDFGIGERAGYFEQTGIIKDMVQSHLFQTLALITMSIPITENAESIHRERYNILSSIHMPPTAKDIVIGQYQSYTREKGVIAHSKTETFAALRLFIDRETWHQVPMYVRTGKRTNESHTFVVIELKKFDFQKPEEEPNRLIIDIQPEAKVTINLVNRLGELDKYQDVMTNASIACDIEGCLPDHAALILDAMKGEKKNFLSFPEIIQTWRLTDAILEAIKKYRIPLKTYTDGSRGPASQDALTKQDGFRWYDSIQESK